MASEPDKSPTTVLASVSPAEAAIEPSATRSLSFAIAVSRATGIAAAEGRQSGLSLSASDSYICNAQGLVCEMVPLLAPRAIVALLLVRKNFIEITPSIQHTDDFRNVIDDAIEDDVWAGHGCVIVPDFGEIGARIRRPDDRSPTLGHAVRSLAGEIRPGRAARPRPRRAIGCPCRSPPATGAASRHATGVAGRFVPDLLPAGSPLRRSLVQGS